MTIRRLRTNISSERLHESRDFYVELLGMVVAEENDWYVKLVSPTDPDLELGIIQRNHPLLPAAWRGAPVGMYLNFVVDNVDDFHARAVVSGLTIVQPPRDEFYGVRRFLTRDPDGGLVEISSPSRKQALPQEPAPVSIAEAPSVQSRPMRARQSMARRRTIEQVLRDARLDLVPAVG